jgi:hypothetical protein
MLIPLLRTAFAADTQLVEGELMVRKQQLTKYGDDDDDASVVVYYDMMMIIIFEVRVWV